MMALPPGVTVNYYVAIEIDRLTEEMVEWFEMIGGKVGSEIKWTRSGSTQNWPVVQYGRGKPSYYRQDGSGGVRLNFHGDDASAASMFILKFMEHVQQHNLTNHYNSV